MTPQPSDLVSGSRAAVGGTVGGVIRAGLAVLRRPGLWFTAVRQAARLAPAGWWRRPPFVPVPSPEYLRFRLLTQYGDARARATGDDLVAYLEWCKRYG